MSARPPSGAWWPLLPVRQAAILPTTVTPIEIARKASLAAVTQAQARARGAALGTLVIAVQRDPMVEDPRIDDLWPVGVRADTGQVLHGLPGRATAIVRALERVRIIELDRQGDAAVVRVERDIETNADTTLAVAMSGALRDLATRYRQHLPDAQVSAELKRTLAVLALATRPSEIADLAASVFDLDDDDRLSLLSELDVSERLRRLLELGARAIESVDVQRSLAEAVRQTLSKHEHEAILRHKMRTIRAQLGEEDASPTLDLDARLDARALPPYVRAAVDRERARLDRMHASSPEALIARTWLEWIADLPWGEGDETVDSVDVASAKRLLDAKQYGLDKPKRRVLEYLCVRSLAPRKRGPILCLAGPPGVGKTSLSRTIAEGLGRKFHRISLGGLRDDAEIRGHRRTYVGALPGRLLQAMKAVGVRNPVILLDEIDKLAGPDIRGDATAALLEALDPEQNDAFEDHYLGVGFDLSHVIFVCTANEVDAIPQVLRDRLEILPLSGYTVDEKVAIARDYLLPRLVPEHGLRDAQIHIEDGTLERLATEYTRESGVRQLERSMAAILRDRAMALAEGRDVPAMIGPTSLEGILGPPRYHDERIETAPRLGVVTGLGWTPTGGRLLLVEATAMRGSGGMRVTGRLGEVMRESASTAASLVRSRAERLGASIEFLGRHDLHIHLPAGAVPKDGPSAGVSLVTAIVSLASGRLVRPDVAMTGEITLRGSVLAIGGVREKVLAAHRAGIREVILPAANRKDEPDIPQSARAGLTLHWAATIEDVLAIALIADPDHRAGDRSSAA